MENKVMVNKIKAVGILLDTRRGEYGFSEIMLLIKRAGMDDLYAVFQLDTVLEPSLSVRRVVEVEGYFRGYNVKQPDGEWKVVRYMVATKVKEAVSALESEYGEKYGAKGHFAPKHYFYAALEGELNVVINTENGWKKLGLKVFGNGKNGLQERPQYITIDVNPTPKLPDIRALQKGDVIASVLNLRTPRRKFSDGQVKVFEDLVVEDFSVVGHNEPYVPKKEENGDKSEQSSEPKKSRRRRTKSDIEVRDIPEDRYPGGKKNYVPAEEKQESVPKLDDVDLESPDGIDDVEEINETPTGE